MLGLEVTIVDFSSAKLLEVRSMVGTEELVALLVGEERFKHC